MWHRLVGLCHPAAEPASDLHRQYLPGLFLTNEEGWLVGPYCGLRGVAQALRWEESRGSCTDPQLQAALECAGLRFGGRVTDRCPDSARRRSIGTLGKPNELTQAQRDAIALRQTPGSAPYRKTDVHPEVAAFWRGRTLEAHHIVEKGLLEELGLNTGKLAPKQALGDKIHAADPEIRSWRRTKAHDTRGQRPVPRAIVARTTCATKILDIWMHSSRRCLLQSPRRSQVAALRQFAIDENTECR